MMSMPRSVAIVAHSPRTVRIALCDASGEAGGAELQLAWTGQLLRERSWQVTFVVPQTGDDCPLGERDGFRVIAAHTPGRYRGPLGYLGGTVRDYWRALAEADASVYLHRGAAGLTGWTALFCKLRHRRCALSVASNPDVDPAAQTGEMRLSPRDRVLYSYYLRHCSLIFAQSPQQADLLAANHHREATLAPNIASLPQTVPAKASEPLVVWAGAIRDVKRPLWALEVARALPGVRFVIAGGPNPGMEGLWAALQARGRELPNVELPGWLSVAEVERLAGEAWALLCTSETEGFPNVYLMAWARETPVVTSFGAGDLVTGSGAGLVRGTPEELARAVEQIISDSRVRTEMGARGRRHVQERHGREAIGDIYDRALAAILENH